MKPDVKAGQQKQMEAIDVAVGLATALKVDHSVDAEIDAYYIKRIPKSRKLGTVKEMIIHKEFFNSVAGLFVEGVEFMTKDQIYKAIKDDFEKAMVALRWVP